MKLFYFNFRNAQRLLGNKKKISEKFEIPLKRSNAQYEMFEFRI